jgi:hypothetical protein
MTRADFLPVLEELYVDSGLLDQMVYRKRPLLALLEKKEQQGGGEQVRVPVKYADPQGRSANFAKSQTNSTPSKRQAFFVTYRSNYGTAQLDGDVIDDAKGNKVYIMDAVSDEMDAAINNLSNDVSTECFRGTGGARGTISSGSNVGTASITLANPEDVIHFEVGMKVAASSANGDTSTDVLRNSGATVTLTGIDRINGVLTASGNWSTGIAAVATGDSLFVDGDFQSKLPGLAAWIPSAAPGGSDSFFGVNRSVDTRLGGLRAPSFTGSIDQNLIQAAALGNRFRATFDLGVINPIKFGELTLARGAVDRNMRMVTVQSAGDARFGFEGIVLDTAAGPIPFISDPSCQGDTAWLLNTDTWQIRYSNSKFIRLIDDDGNETTRGASTDSFEFRVKSRGTLICKAPGLNMRVPV